MNWDLYHIIYRISSNFLPYFIVTLLMMLFLGYSLFRGLYNLRFLRKIRRALALYVEKNR